MHFIIYSSIYFIIFLVIIAALQQNFAQYEHFKVEWQSSLSLSKSAKESSF